MPKRRKVLIILGVVLILFCGLGSWFTFNWANQTINAQENDAKDFGKYATELIASEWSETDLRRVVSAQFFHDVDELHQKTWLKAMKSELGALKSLDKLGAKLRAGNDIDGKQALFADFSCIGTFEKNKVYVRMRLVKRDIGDWSAAAIDFDPVNPKPKKPADTDAKSSRSS